MNFFFFWKKKDSLSLERSRPDKIGEDNLTKNFGEELLNPIRCMKIAFGWNVSRAHADELVASMYMVSSTY